MLSIFLSVETSEPSEHYLGEYGRTLCGLAGAGKYWLLEKKEHAFNPTVECQVCNKMALGKGAEYDRVITKWVYTNEAGERVENDSPKEEIERVLPS